MAENYKHLYEQMKLMVEKYQDEIVPGLRKVIEDLEAERRWISVEERLPEGETKVLALTKHRTRLIVSYNPMFERWIAGGNVVVTHWMPLPEMPGEERIATSAAPPRNDKTAGASGARGTDCHSSCGASQ